MTFKEYLQKLDKYEIYDDGQDFDFPVIFAKEILKYAHDVELETKDGFFKYLKITNYEPWFIALARSVYRDYEKSLKDAL
ncbi:hypothetical protein [Streptococcus danieliae]|uniref:hypothetical protein n=1 Tax=Streptococcus danieliae TaxID=747656 RepID=UPI0021CA466B|nr:hypothetical protein [Streptococcus danieliae]MCU0082594.1 hypothetical protein [Streptococcus danieliae]